MASGSRSFAQFSSGIAPRPGRGVVGGHRSLRITLFSSSRVWGGAEEQLRLLALGLADRGHHCHVLCKARSPVERRLEADGVQVQRVLSAYENKLSPWGWWRLRTAVREAEPDILLLNDSASILSARFSGAWRFARATVHVRHTCFPMRHPGLYDRVCRAIVCVTQETARICTEGGLPGEKLRVIHPGSDPGRLEAGNRERGRNSLGLSSAQPLLLTVAALVDCKGHETLLRSLAQVAEQFPGLQLALAGEGPLRSRLERLAADLGVAGRVRFLGFRSDIPDLLQAADVCVIPSHLEGICSTLIETMLAGRPVVTTLVGGMAEVATPPHSLPLAWTVTAADAPGLAAAIRAALASPEERLLRAERARESAIARFTPEKTLDGFERLFLELTAENAPANGAHAPHGLRAAG
jgi:glycosyltransferase involved in cell wall biosynthesis